GSAARKCAATAARPETTPYSAATAPGRPGACALTPAPRQGGAGGAFQFREQLAVQTAEAAVAHYEQVVSGARRAGEIARQRVDVAAAVSALAERSEHPAGVPAQIRCRVQPHLVRGGERRGEREPMHAHA